MVPENTSTFYVNDGSTQGDEFTTAGGSNRNSGKLPAHQALSEQYPANVRIGPTQTLYIDSGSYDLVSPLVISNTPGLGDDEGFTLTGPLNANHTATFDHANPIFTSAPIVELSDADFVTLARVSLEGGTNGVLVHNGSENFTGSYLRTHTPPRMAFTWR